jgi:erythromycin esterase-like protein
MKSLNRTFKDRFEAMTQDIRDFVNDSHHLVALGEPDHREPAFGEIRNELFAQLAERGFRSFALESDRVAALAVNGFVQDGVGTLDEAMAQGFSHGFGEFAANRALVAWMREYNTGRAAVDRLAFHGIDAPFEFTAQSPRRYLEHVIGYLGLDLDVSGLAGEDERWERMEAVTDPARSPGGTPEAARLRAIADDLLSELYVRAPELVPGTSRARWDRARIHATTALGLLRYHREAARPGADGERWSRLGAVRDAVMAQNLLDIRALEADRGPTLLSGHNVHLQRTPSRMSMGGMDLAWSGTGAILASLLGPRYLCVVGSLGRSEGIDLPAPDPGTYEGGLQDRFDTWGLISADALPEAAERTDVTSPQGPFPLDRMILEGADAVLHVSEGRAAKVLCRKGVAAAAGAAGHAGRDRPARPVELQGAAADGLLVGDRGLPLEVPAARGVVGVRELDDGVLAAQ